MSGRLPSQPAGPPTVFVEDGSIISTRDLNDLKGKGLVMHYKGVCNPGAGPSGKAVGQIPQAQYTATGQSVICADTISKIDVDGIIDLSVTMTPSQAPAVCQSPPKMKACNNETNLCEGNSASSNTAFLSGRAEETLPSCKAPAVEMIIKHKVELIKYLMVDRSLILQHVHAKQIVTDEQYLNMKSISQPEETITNLVDRAILNGQESCSRFLEILQEADVVRTYPQLKKIPWC